jgi:hypothetical protein
VTGWRSDSKTRYFSTTKKSPSNSIAILILFIIIIIIIIFIVNDYLHYPSHHDLAGVTFIWRVLLSMPPPPHFDPTGFLCVTHDDAI